jgi:predicted metal-dependent HD superfamily phosphohydrolase
MCDRGGNTITHATLARWLELWSDQAKNAPLRYIGKLIEDESLARVISLIMATKHVEPPRNNDERLIADIDLTILGRPTGEYQEYEDGVRQEYGWVQEERFRAGRAEVLARFLAREHIYYTDHFREKYEENARANLSNSISTLRSSS